MKDKRGRFLSIAVLILVLSAILTACGGGGTSDTTPPAVSSTSPANNATGVAVNSAITAAFTEAMTASTITTATFTLKQGATVVAGTVTYSGTTATFTPSVSLAYSTVYTATITTGVKDLAGNAMASAYTWSFTTGAAPIIPSAVNLPKTGQTTCYNTAGAVIACAGTGQDGDLKKGVAWPVPRFTPAGDCVTDNLTGLMWVKAPDSTTRTWANALTYANGLNLCGHDDWRLPNRKELRSLINYGEANSAAWLNSQGFSNVQAHYYWSSTTVAGSTGYAWCVPMWVGGVGGNDKGSTYYVWPVRAGQ